MNIVMSGASGLVGSALLPELVRAGHKVIRLVRQEARAGTPELCWDASGPPMPSLFEGFDAVIHLAGENIAGRWTEAKKQRIRESRVNGTRHLADSLAVMVKPPRVLVMASAIGYYGDRGEELLKENSGPGTDFLADVCQQWEAAAAPAEAAGIRVVKLRLGVVLAKHGGALAKLLTPFELGVGGRVGSGRQYWSWVTLSDVTGAFMHALAMESLRGPVNVTAPAPARNAEFTQALGRALHRPTIFPLPAFAAKLALGEMAEVVLLASQKVDGSKLAASGYNFRHPELQPALAELLRA
ncbi:MAG: TIGR01777 family protein [Candidatus Koribacter versatilis]|uniref:TIGR01777 family protein n=1 Tax=Candidatus Korobacter versatilis TaxID=658062 RepID=A0A932A7C0_9BACT|nr:TIGR01777 family protein [Candidatus Koribacter versatilis]